MLNIQNMGYQEIKQQEMVTFSWYKIYVVAVMLHWLYISWHIVQHAQNKKDNLPPLLLHSKIWPIIIETKLSFTKSI